MNRHGPEYERWQALHPKESTIMTNEIDYDHEPINQGAVAVTPVAPEVIDQQGEMVRSLIVPTATLEAYRDQTVTEARARVLERRRLIDVGEDTLHTAERGLQAAEDANVLFQQRTWRGRLQGARSGLTRRRRELAQAEKFLTLVEDGYLPIPRLPAVEVERLRDPLPVEVLEILKGEQEKGMFTEFSVIGGRDRWARRATRRPVGRDPILVGLCDGEMFPLAWWR